MTVWELRIWGLGLKAWDFVGGEGCGGPERPDNGHAGGIACPNRRKQPNNHLKPALQGRVAVLPGFMVW